MTNLPEVRRSRLGLVVFGIDALLSIGFGVASWLYPLSTYATIVDLEDPGTSPVTMSALSGLSVFYVVIGLVCLCAAFMPRRQALGLALVMLARHAWIGIHGYRGIGQEWLIGNPWPDIVIHGAFVLAYSFLVLLAVRGSSGSSEESPSESRQAGR
ncbi:MAG: hypothetical protein OES25_13960 [Acidobacteriota bacterium]|nr:hypothetical protein [Acidobacteriota bacterium]